MRVAVLGSQFGRMAGAHAGAAQEQQDIVLARYLAQLGQKIRIRDAARIGVPLYRRMLNVVDVDPADPVAFGIGAHVDQFHVDVGLQ